MPGPAGDRREQVVAAAVAEFAAGGFHGATTAGIAGRVGVSQPYLYRLFPDKRALFAAAAEHCFGVLADTLERACRGLRGAPALAAVDVACAGLLAQRREVVLLLLHLAAAAPSSPHPEDARRIRAAWLALGDGVAARTGLSGQALGARLARSLVADVLRGPAGGAGRGR
ncbi:TetR/AcrR family transcriptional regulator [Streptomyces sp. Q6]|uniref:TetR/AcrR family transcriptional regulator n=1 Tax=Streptomyces citrinus TaxID=3118173 RepID=A0ACD5AHT3_9ACTN